MQLAVLIEGRIRVDSDLTEDKAKLQKLKEAGGSLAKKSY